MIQRRTLSALIAATLGWGATAAHAEQPAAAAASQQDLQQQIESLRQQVKELQAQRAAPAYTARDVDATVSSVIRDADRRSVLLSEEGSPFLGGWKGGKFLIQSADGNFLLHPWFQFQPRYVYNYRENAKNGDGSDQQSGFEIRRMKFGIDGNAFGPNVTYLINWATDRKSGNLVLEEAWLRWKFADQWAVRFGQIKDPLAHEQMMSSKVLLAADRSLVNELFIGGDDFVQGITLGYGADADALQAEVGFTDGSQSANTNFQDDANDTATPQNRPDFGVAGRVQYKLFGDWKDYQDFTALNTKKDLLVAGAGGDWTQTSDTNVYLHTVDVQYENPTGLGAYAAFVGRYTEPGAGSSRYDWAAFGQLSYLVNASVELFGRYGYMSFDGDTFPTASDRDIHEITAGLNYYFHAHAAKLTFDVTYLPHGSPAGADNIGVLPEPNGDTEIVVRGQFQLLL